MIETILSLGKIGDTVNSTIGAYKAVSAIIKGGTRSELALDKVISQLGEMNQSVERLSDTILYAPNLEMVKNLSAKEKQLELRDIKEQLDPIQKILNTDILSSARIETPKKMQEAFETNPWDVLINISPIKYAKKPNESGFMPISFYHERVWYIGWQKQGILPSMFDCEYLDLSNILTNNIDNPQTRDEQLIDVESTLKKIIQWSDDNDIPDSKVPRDIENLKKLERLDLSYMAINSLPNEIVGLTNLSILNLGGNLLTSLPTNIGELKSLTEIYLWENELMDLPLSFSRLIHLKILNLDSNNFSIFPSCIQVLKQLKVLSIGCGCVCKGNNKIDFIPQSIEALINLESINLSGLGLKSITFDVSKLEKLVYLGLYSNELEELPSSIGNLNKLEYLILNANNLKTLPESFKKLKNLQEFSVVANFYLYIDEYNLSQYPKIIQKSYHEIPLVLIRKIFSRFS